MDSDRDDYIRNRRQPNRPPGLPLLEPPTGGGLPNPSLLDPQPALSNRENQPESARMQDNQDKDSPAVQEEKEKVTLV